MKPKPLPILVAAVALLGCSKNDTPPTAEPTGVEACDAYIARLVACAEKAPEDAQPAHRAAIATARDALAAKAKMDDQRNLLAEACKQMAERPSCD